ncbi:hypothetical protein ACA910_004436 [Epithemia clementina (nom. ined.)]
MCKTNNDGGGVATGLFEGWMCCWLFLLAIQKVEATITPFTLISIKDSFTRASSTNSNYGSSQTLDVKLNNKQRTYVKFDISGVDPSLVAPAVGLRMWAYTASS